jgi:hypothetical protein
VRSTSLLALLLAAACATARPPGIARDVPISEQVQAPGLLFELVYTPRDAEVLPQIREALLAVGPRLARWGSFRQGVHIRLFPDHEALEAAIDRRGYPWLRAWAYGDEVLLQSPRSWSAPGSAAPGELGELLTHELTHALMYQLLEPDGSSGWPETPLDEPPLWFREGMASVTAGQGHRRPSSEELSHWAEEHPDIDVFHPSPEIYRTEKEAVYGAAHRAFDLLLRDCGEEAVRGVFRGVRQGAKFADAFRTATGRELGQFEMEALRSGFSAPRAAEGSSPR